MSSLNESHKVLQLSSHGDCCKALRDGGGGGGGDDGGDAFANKAVGGGGGGGGSPSFTADAMNDAAYRHWADNVLAGGPYASIHFSALNVPKPFTCWIFVTENFQLISLKPPPNSPHTKCLR